MNKKRQTKRFYLGEDGQLDFTYTFQRQTNIARKVLIQRLIKKNRQFALNQTRKNQAYRDWLRLEGLELQPLKPAQPKEEDEKQEKQDKMAPEQPLAKTMSNKLDQMANVAQPPIKSPTKPSSKPTQKKGENQVGGRISQNAAKKKGRRHQLTVALLRESQNPVNVLPFLSNVPKSSSQATKIYTSITREVFVQYPHLSNIPHAILQEIKAKFSRAQQNSFWRILECQLGAYSRANTLLKNVAHMLTSSLRLIHAEFEDRLKEKQFDAVVRQYAALVDRKELEEDTNLMWVQIWVAYCAGLTKKVHEVLACDSRDHQDLSRLYQLTQQQVFRGNPQTHIFNRNPNIKDICYDQFIYSLIGLPHYSSEKLTPFTSLDFLFITVRSFGIFYQTQQNAFEQARRGIVNLYLEQTLQAQTVRKMLYLLDYNTIVKVGPNALMSKQDYLHFLIVISGFPDLLTDAPLAETLAQKLHQFIKNLLGEGNTDYIYYIPLLAEQKQVESISEIIFQTRALDRFDWKGLSQLVQATQFKKIVTATLQKCARRDPIELKAAYMLKDLCQDQKGACDYLITLLINHHLARNKYEPAHVQEAQTLGLYLSRDLSTVYQLMFELMSDLRQIVILLPYRRKDDLKELIERSPFASLRLWEQGQLYNQVFQILHKNKGLGVYYMFMRFLVKGTQIYAPDNKGKLAALKQVLRNQLEDIHKLVHIRGQQGRGVREPEDPHLRDILQELAEQQVLIRPSQKKPTHPYVSTLNLVHLPPK